MAVMRFNPVTGNPIEAFFKGQQQGATLRDDMEARRARGLEGAALQGDVGALNKLAGLNPQAYKGAVDWNSLTNTDQARLINAAATQADTPEKWQAISGRLTAAGVPGADIPFSERGKVMNESGRILGISEGRTKAAEREFAQKMELKNAGKSPGTTVNINTGDKREALTKPTRNKIQKDLDSLLTTREALKDVASKFDPEALTWQGQLLSEWQRFADKTGSETLRGMAGNDRLKKQTEFFNSVNKVFNQYRKDITGAAASIQELESLKKAIFNTDQSPEEFKASYKAFVDGMNRAVSIKQDLLDQGIPLNSEEFGSELNRRFLGAAPSETAPAAPSSATSTAPARRATNPTTGEVIELRNGEWVPVQ